MQAASIQGRQDNAGPYEPWKLRQRRNLKIENLTDPFSRGRTVRSGIQLKGGWLDRAGFHPGQRVAMIVLELGLMRLRIIPETAQRAEPLPLQSELVFQSARRRAMLPRESRKG